VAQNKPEKGLPWLLLASEREYPGAKEEAELVGAKLDTRQKRNVIQEVQRLRQQLHNSTEEQ
jgi:hypothetical protein